MDPEQTFLRVHARLSGMLSQLLTPRIRLVLEYVYLAVAVALFCLLVVMHINFVQQVTRIDPDLDLVFILYFLRFVTIFLVEFRIFVEKFGVISWNLRSNDFVISFWMWSLVVLASLLELISPRLNFSRLRYIISSHHIWSRNLSLISASQVNSKCYNINKKQLFFAATQPSVQSLGL